MKKIEKLFFGALFGATILMVANFWKIGIVFGTHSLFFTASNIFGPLLGTIFGSWTILAALFLKRFIAWNFLGLPLFSSFSTYIPTFFAAWYWNMPSKIIRFFVPLICMFAFVIHPIGFQARGYACYWLIPIILYFVRPQSFFLHALASTFIQHAVGSIIWLYFMPTTATFWYNLLPIVCIERLFFASGMVVTVYLVRICRAFITQKFQAYESLFSFLVNRRILANKH